MLSQPKTARQTRAPAPDSVLAKGSNPIETFRSDDYPWGRNHAGPEPVSNFIKGVLIALPLSISLWAGMIMGLRAIF
ncbi:MAG: hypothetical protein P8010_12970 [Desulfosarcinaceae bacterium]|jgi:hypothetical protein